MESIDIWDIELWAAKSRRGEVCGILGCSNEVVIKCPYCENWYCKEHKDSHFHTRDFIDKRKDIGGEQ